MQSGMKSEPGEGLCQNARRGAASLPINEGWSKANIVHCYKIGGSTKKPQKAEH